MGCAVIFFPNLATFSVYRYIILAYIQKILKFCDFYSHRLLAAFVKNHENQKGAHESM